MIIVRRGDTTFEFETVEDLNKWNGSMSPVTVVNNVADKEPFDYREVVFGAKEAKEHAPREVSCGEWNSNVTGIKPDFEEDAEIEIITLTSLHEKGLVPYRIEASSAIFEIDVYNDDDTFSQINACGNILAWRHVD